MISFAAAYKLSTRMNIFSQDTGSIVPWVMNNEQVAILKAICGRSRVTTLKARQIGSTTIHCYYIALCAFANPNTPICLLNYKYDESKALIKKVKKFLGQLGASYVVDNATDLQLTNGSTITAVTAMSPADGESKAGRGGTYKLVYASEAAYYSNSTAVFASASATMTKQAQLLLESTATPGSCYFRTVWDDNNEYTKLFFSVESHAGYVRGEQDISDEDWEFAKEHYFFTSRPHAAWWLNKLRSDMGGDEVRMKREYPVTEAHAWSAAQGRWVSVDPPVLSYVAEGKVKYFTAPHPDHYYILGVDPAGGSGGDDAVIIVYDMTDNKIAAILADNHTTMDSLVDIAGMLSSKYRAQKIYIEKNGIGHGATLMGRMASLPIQEFNTTEETKYRGMLLARRWIEQGGGGDESLLANAQSCRMDLVGTKEKFSGKKDVLMALGFALRYAPEYETIMAQPKPKVYAANEFNASKIIANSMRRRRR